MKALLTVSICICITFMILSFMPVHGESEIYSSVLRLHVLANSDSDEDQALKLKVRDTVLEKAAELTRGCTSLESAEAVLHANKETIRKAAQARVEAEGYDYPVSVELGIEEYPTRTYESLCFPSGNYLSLRVMIGDADGKNWWCVLFPPMCLSAASGSECEDAFISVGLNPDQYQIITETEDVKYNVRFKILEAIEGAF
ncbi:MAG: stage II sporulation protein R [Clostridia bacterium]|nr:stage II sporulation protein R [Clostridia bacterium]